MHPDRFWFTGPVPDAELAAYYRHAHAYVSLSEHEGFCVPLVEAMAMDVPCSPTPPRPSRKRSAAPACRSRPRTWSWPRSCSARSCTMRALRQPLLAGQRRRVAAFSRAGFEARLRDVLAPFAA